MDKPKVTPKDFFQWAGAMVALYVAVFYYIALVWEYINYTFPDALSYSVEPYQSGISWEMASLIILTPVFLLLMWFIRRNIARDPTRKEIWVRRWALFLTIFAAGVSIVVDLIYVLYAFLNGEDLTERFLLKALIVVMVAGIGFMHFLADLWGYWDQYPQRNRYVVWAVIALVLLTIVAGFFIVGTPQQARNYRFDDQKVNDLMTIQSEVVSYWQMKQVLPMSLSDLNDPISGFNVPTDPQTNSSYEYKTTGKTSFELCADFNAVSQSNSSAYYSQPVMPASVGGVTDSNDSWYHGAGNTCFTRTIDPSRYPALNKKTP